MGVRDDDLSWYPDVAFDSLCSILLSIREEGWKKDAAARDEDGVRFSKEGAEGSHAVTIGGKRKLYTAASAAASALQKSPRSRSAEHPLRKPLALHASSIL